MTRWEAGDRVSLLRVEKNSVLWPAVNGNQPKILGNLFCLFFISLSLAGCLLFVDFSASLRVSAPIASVFTGSPPLWQFHPDRDPLN